MSRQLIIALKGVCDELEAHAPNSPALHFARGVLACGPAAVRVKAPREPRPYNGKYLPQADAIVADYVAGGSLLEVGAKYGCGAQLVKRLLDERGIEARRPSGRPQMKAGPDERLPEIMAMRAEGATLEEIGLHFKITRERVRQIVAKGGLKDRFAERPLKPEEIAILNAYAEGDPLVMTAEKLGVGVGTARRRLEGMGIPIRPNGKLADARERRNKLAAKIAGEYQKGRPAREIAEEFGYKTPEQIYRYLAIAGVKASRSGSRPYARFPTPTQGDA